MSSPGVTTTAATADSETTPATTASASSSSTTHNIITLKLLLTNEQCGALIGKGGGTVVSLQDRFGISLKLGGPDDLFPGTIYRPGIMRGTVDALRSCLDAIVNILWGVSFMCDAEIGAYRPSAGAQ